MKNRKGRDRKNNRVFNTTKTFIGILFASVISCNTSTNKEIVIQGSVKGLPDGKIYLTEAHRFRFPLDSTTVKDGKFEFRIVPDSNFYPFFAGLTFPDSLSWSKLGTITFKSTNCSGFYLEPGKTMISSDNLDSIRLPNGAVIIKADVTLGKQSRIMVQERIGFGAIGRKQDSVRQKRFSFVKNEIKKHPQSYFLIESIYDFRTHYSKNEIKELLELASTEIRHSPLAKKIDNYLRIRGDDDKPLPSLVVVDETGNAQQLQREWTRPTLLVFWASWCKPCRAEIPHLKILYKELVEKTYMNIVSVSIDENISEWQKALKEEKMPWKQYVIDDKERDAVWDKYNFEGVPLMLVVDVAGFEKSRHFGFDSTNLNSFVTKAASLISK